MEVALFAILDKIIYFVVLALGWVARMLYNDIKELSKEIKQVQINYAPRTEIQQMRQEIKSEFDEVKELIKELRK